MPLNYEPAGKLFRDPRSRNCRFSFIVHPVQHDDEFVAIHFCNCILFSRASLDPLSNILQQQIAYRVTEGIVNEFESVEIEGQKRNFNAFATGTSQCFQEPILEQSSIRQSSQRIVIGQKLDTLFGIYAV
jgi:hypothetical protein